MPRTSRTARATRVASAACSSVPSLLRLPLMVGAFLAALWLFGAAPAHAGGPEGTGTPGSSPSGSSASENGSLVSEVLGAEPPGSRGSVPLGVAVPGEAPEPIAATLGTVRQGIERSADRATAAATAVLPQQDWLVGEADDGARSVVRGLNQTRQATAENILAPVATVVAKSVLAPVDDSGGAGTEPRSGLRERSEDEAPAHHAIRGTGPRVVAETVGVYTVGASAPGDGTAHHGPHPRSPASPSAPLGQLSPGAAAPSAGSAPVPAIAGYLTAMPVTTPSADAVLFTPHSLRPVPSGPSDDPTASPD